MFGKEDKRQGITATEFPSTVSYLYIASRYVNSLMQNPGITETTLVKNADEKVSTVISKINEEFNCFLTEFFVVLSFLQTQLTV